MNFASISLLAGQKDDPIKEPHKVAQKKVSTGGAVERYDPEREAVVVIESEKGFEVSILSASGSKSVGGLFYNPDEA